MSHPWITFLVTGPEEALMAWQLEAMASVELFDRRGQTVRCRAHAGPPFMDLEQWQREIDAGTKQTMDRAEKLLAEAVELAKANDVTVQRLDYDAATRTETYPVLALASHGMKWQPEQRKKRNNQSR